MLDLKVTLFTPSQIVLASEFLAKLGAMSDGATSLMSAVGAAQQQVASKQLQSEAGFTSSPADPAGNEAGAVDTATPTAPAAETKKRGRPRKEEVAAAEPQGEPAAAESSTAPQPSQSTTETPQATVPSLDDVRAALGTLTTAKGMDAGINLLREHSAGRISELAEDKRAAFIAACASAAA